ncbi:hypothetical protein [Streptomyces venezuelae]|uniref:Exonuclease n=1 Tax=Streptomyces venezuelae TaxID=54571 RepID=A0A5P2BFA0_STRVZ|nr:hypothetical protein [Streptomyces venezuelae]QES29175.1 hypothetical protein DEJ47_24515 [Streptomyces venezuelae]
MALTITALPAPAPSVPRDGWGRPLVVPKEGGKPRGLTRTTTFIDAIEDKSGLMSWKQRMTLVGAAREGSLLREVANLNPETREGKARLDALAERAVTVAGANAKRERGTHLHTLSEFVDRGEHLPAGVATSDVADMAAYKMSTAPFDVVAVETFVVVPELGVGGTFDRMVSYSGPGPDGEHVEGLFIADLKTGSIEYSRLKMASQLAVYSRGELYDHTLFPVNDRDKKALAAWKRREVPADLARAAYAPIPAVSQDWGIILHLPAGSGECTPYWADLRLGWEAAKAAQNTRSLRGKNRSALRPF